MIAIVLPRACGLGSGVRRPSPSTSPSWCVFVAAVAAVVAVVVDAAAVVIVVVIIVDFDVVANRHLRIGGRTVLLANVTITNGGPRYSSGQAWVRLKLCAKNHKERGWHHCDRRTTVGRQFSAGPILSGVGRAKKQVKTTTTIIASFYVVWSKRFIMVTTWRAAAGGTSLGVHSPAPRC